MELGDQRIAQVEKSPRRQAFCAKLQHARSPVKKRTCKINRRPPRARGAFDVDNRMKRMRQQVSHSGSLRQHGR